MNPFGYAYISTVKLSFRHLSCEILLSVTVTYNTVRIVKLK